MNKTKSPLPEPNDVLFRIKRGLSGYVSYLAACETNVVFSEYILYEPILRILMAQGFKVQCEVKCPGIEQPVRGDKRKIDFVATKDRVNFALEVKWVRSHRPRIDEDRAKLNAFLTATPSSLAFLCLFGRRSHLEKIEIPPQFSESGSPIFADFKITMYGCRIFQAKRHGDSINCPPNK